MMERKAEWCGEEGEEKKMRMDEMTDRKRIEIL